MTTPITDEELPAIEEADRILRTGGGDVTHGAVVARAVPRMIARIRADAATIADLRRQVEQRDAQVKILLACFILDSHRSDQLSGLEFSRWVERAVRQTMARESADRAMAAAREACTFLARDDGKEGK